MSETETLEDVLRADNPAQTRTIKNDMEITPKFKKGEEVYVADCEYDTKYIACPDCLGTLHWIIVFADGDAVEAECQTCKRGYLPPSGEIPVSNWRPTVKKMTIGSIRYNDQDKEPFSYMCEETGIGSGRVYYDKDLFKEETPAKVKAHQKYEGQKKGIAKNNFSKRFGGIKEIEDSLSTWGFSRKMQIEKVAQFKEWAGISGIVKRKIN